MNTISRLACRQEQFIAHLKTDSHKKDLTGQLLLYLPSQLWYYELMCKPVKTT